MEMEHYYRRLQKTALEGFAQLNGTPLVAKQHHAIAAGSLDMSVARGTVLEKAATARIRLSTQNPATGEDTRFDIFQIKIYPANPRSPIMLFNMENRVARQDGFHGFLDVAPVAARGDDLDCLHGTIRSIAAEHGADYEDLRKRVEGIYRMDHWDKALNAGIGMRLEIPAEQADFAREAALTWLTTYLRIAAGSSNEPYTQEDEKLMYAVRARIMEFYMLKDMSFKVIQALGLTAEVMGRVHFAPVIKY